MANYETILVDRKNDVVTVTLNRPHKKNAMSPKLHQIPLFPPLSKGDEGGFLDSFELGGRKFLELFCQTFSTEALQM